MVQTIRPKIDRTSRLKLPQISNPEIDRTSRLKLAQASILNFRQVGLTWFKQDDKQQLSQVCSNVELLRIVRRNWS